MPIEIAQRPFNLYSAGLTVLFGLLFMLQACDVSAIQRKKVKPVVGVVKAMTVMAVDSPQKNEDYYTISFRVSQMRYRLPVKSDRKYLKLLKASERNHQPVLVWRTKEDSDLIIRVEKK